MEHQTNPSQQKRIISEGDAYELLPKMPVADLILTDPPYNISQDNNFNTMSDRQGLDFGESQLPRWLLLVLKRKLML